MTASVLALDFAAVMCVNESHYVAVLALGGVAGAGYLARGLAGLATSVITFHMAKESTSVIYQRRQDQ